MENIIQNFIQKVTNFDELEVKNFTGISEKIKKDTDQFSKDIFRSILESLDEEISGSSERKRKWYIERYDKRIIMTSLGKIEFVRRYYANKHKKKEYAYLLDQLLGINKYQRIDESVEARLLKFASEMSYEKAGSLFSKENKVSKQTVKNKVSKFKELDLKEEEPEKKKKIRYLFIDADEDHISLQNKKKKEGKSKKQKGKINKLIYVYEGKYKESKSRNVLMNKKVFASVEKSSDDLWLEVLDYIYENYEMESIEKIYIQGDGARWIKSGENWIDKSVHVIDKFHLNKGIMKLAGGSLEEGIGKEIRELLYSKDRKNFIKKSKQIIETEEDEKRKERKQKAFSYINNQWKGIEEFLSYKDSRKLGCSAEGHVSHILASRCSSRPQGWSISGLESLTKLRVYFENKRTEKELEKILGKHKIKKANEKNEKLKHTKRLKKKFGEMLDNLSAVNLGQVNNTYKAVKNLSRA